MKIGDKVEYKDDDGNTKEGVVYGVRKAEVKGTERIVGYVVDTGEIAGVSKVTNDKGKKVDREHPVLLDFLPDEINAVK